MLGTGRVYEYLTCASCDARAIAVIPADLAASYPPHYGAPATDRSRDKLRAFARLNVKQDARIVDVGASHGAFLYRLAERGFSNLTGIDPYAPTEIRDERITIRRDNISSLREGSVDVLTLHHVFEHVPDPAACMGEIARALGKDGRALVRVPLADSWAAREYGANWVQHDAPRHLTIPTCRGLESAAQHAGLVVIDQWRDEGGWQAWAGARVAAGDDVWHIPAWKVRAGRWWHELAARRRNARGDGDQGVFILRHR